MPGVSAVGRLGDDQGMVDRHRKDKHGNAFWMQLALTTGGLAGLLLFVITHLR